MAEPSNNSITIFDAETGHEFKVIENHLPDHQIQSFSYSPDGKLFVVSSKDKTLRIWDAETGEQISVLKATLDRFW